jgi:hypothetical protein
MVAYDAGADAMLAWTEAGVIAQALGSIGIILTLVYSAWTFATTLREGYYTELDRVYFDLLKIRVERPHLLSCRASCPAAAPLQPADPAQAREYDAYAFMVWNFLETVVDRCEGASNRHLRETWYPVVATENALHRAWFDMPENRRKFKERFCRFIEANYPVPAPAGTPTMSSHLRPEPSGELTAAPSIDHAK